jgi:hypothetical protein
VKNEMKEVFGLTVPIVSKGSLIAYKKKLMREVDIADIHALESISDEVSR